jgi:hypothetical protein
MKRPHTHPHNRLIASGGVGGHLFPLFEFKTYIPGSYFEDIFSFACREVRLIAYELISIINGMKL